MLKDLDPYKAHGPDEIFPYVLKECEEMLDRPLELPFKKLVEDGSLPEEWQRANSIPVFQKKSLRNYTKLEASVSDKYSL